jgi:hypothetical protein
MNPKRKPARILLLAAGLVAATLWWAAGQGERQAGGPPPTQGGPLLAGARFSSWQGGDCVYTLEITGLELIPKRLGPFKLGDSRDINASDCRLEVDEAALSSIFQELGRTLVNLVKPLTPGRADADPDEGGPQQALIVLPPKIVAAPFAGRIAYPQDAWLSIRADLATFDPQDPRLRLQGHVKVVSSRGACLQADEASWEVPEGRLLVEGRFTLRQGKRSRAGSLARFSLAGGRVKMLRPGRQALPAQGPPTPAFMPVTLLVQALAGKNLHGYENFMVPLLAAAQTGGAASTELGQPVPAPWLEPPHPQQD